MKISGIDFPKQLLDAQKDNQLVFFFAIELVQALDDGFHQLAGGSASTLSRMHRSMMLSYVLNVALDISPAMPSGAASRSPLKGLSRCRSAAWTNRSSVIGLSLYFPDQIDCPARGTLWRAVNYKTAA